MQSETKTKHPSLCMSCIGRLGGNGNGRVEMLSGYCIVAKCDGCGHRTDLAMCAVKGDANAPS